MSFFFLLFFLSKMCGNVLQASPPNGEPFCWNFAEDTPPPSDTRSFLFLFLPYFFTPVSLVKEEMDLLWSLVALDLL